MGGGLVGITGAALVTVKLMGLEPGALVGKPGHAVMKTGLGCDRQLVKNNGTISSQNTVVAKERAPLSLGEGLWSIRNLTSFVSF